MKEIPLTNSPLKARVSDCDFVRVSQHNWRWIPAGQSGKGYVRTSINRKNVYLHRFIFSDDLLRDHRNRDGLNCQRSNLRICTPSQNGANRGKQFTKTSSRYKGVLWHKRDKRWVAKIRHHRKVTHLGNFASEHDAAGVYNEAAKMLFGEFACLNVINRSGLAAGRKESK